MIDTSLNFLEPGLPHVPGVLLVGERKLDRSSTTLVLPKGSKDVEIDPGTALQGKFLISFNEKTGITALTIHCFEDEPSDAMTDNSSYAPVRSGALLDITCLAIPIEKRLRAILQKSHLPYARALADRLVEIASILREDEDDPIQLREGPVISLITFLESNPQIARPQLAPTATGGLVARWLGEADSVSVNVFFLAGNSAKYYVSTPNEENPRDTDWDSGATTPKSLYSKLERHGALRWMKG